MAIGVAMAGMAALAFGCRKATKTELPELLSEAEALKLFSNPVAKPAGPQWVFHLGHSLVGRDMPVMLAQLAGEGHHSNFQIGWGSSLKDHWNDEINGFEQENNHPAARRAFGAIDGGSYDAIVFTEMVEIRDAIKYHFSAEYLYRWARRAREANPEVRLYFYETWPNIDDEEGWQVRVGKDLGRYWEDQILLPAIRAEGQPIYLIPGGQALAGVVEAVTAAGGVDGVSLLEDFFAISSDGSQDTIHLSDLGNYVIAVTHYAVLYRASPVGLPRALLRADGSAATAPGVDLARLIRQTVWDTVQLHRKTGILW